eukprot:9967295-Alexandrium_andersonii.AAC.1
MQRAGSRVKVDPTITVQELETTVNEWLNSQSTRDLPALLKPLTANTRKTAPVCSLLADFAS